MSLFIGNLAARTRGYELKRVFQKFGPCDLRLKYKYGFVVFDFVQDAEEALRELRGKNICGQPLELAWSSKQPKPKPFERHPRGGTSYQFRRGRNPSRGGGYSSRNMSSSDWRGYNVDDEQRDSDVRRIDSGVMLTDDSGGQQEDVKAYHGKYHDSGGLAVDSDGVVPMLVDTGRWSEQVHDQSNANGVDDRVEFDRYEPCRGHDRKDVDENHHMAYSGGGSGPRSAQENGRRERSSYTTLNQSNDLKLRNTCFSCGGLGHKIRDCPRKYSSARKFAKFDYGQDDARCENRGEAELERFRSRSWGKLLLSKDSVSRHENIRTGSGSEKHQSVRNYESSPGRSECDRTEIKDPEGKKRSRGETESPKRQSGKKPRRSVSSSHHSGSPESRTTSHSTSESSKSMSRSGSRTRSRSVSNRAHSLSSNSRSSSKSKSSKSRSRSVSSGAHSLSSNSRSSLKSNSSKSRSRSSSSISLSGSRSQSPSSLNKVYPNLKASTYNAMTPKSTEMVVENRQPIEGDACIEICDDGQTIVPVKSNHAGSEVEDDMKNDRHSQSNYDNDENADDDNINALVKSNHALSGSEVEDDRKTDQPLQTNDGNDENHTSVTNPSTPMPEIGDHGAGNLFSEGLKNTLDLEHSGAPVVRHMPSELKEPTPENCMPSGHSRCISSDEMCMVLKHYGLEIPEESERHSPIESYFGSARLWPWEVIYYRRLKKGLISVENYAKRVAQNQEFGITDTYIRSSSGWGEISQEYP